MLLMPRKWIFKMLSVTILNAIEMDGNRACILGLQPADKNINCFTLFTVLGHLTLLMESA